MSKLKNIWNKFINLLYPEYGCFVCGRENENPEKYICPRCEKSLIKFDGDLCEKCGAPVIGLGMVCLECKNNSTLYFTKARAVYRYDELSSRPVRELKYKGKKFLVPFMASKMFEILPSLGVMPDIVIAVPTTDNRRKQRGFNQAELITEELNKLCEFKMENLSCIISRTKEAERQVTLTRKERLENLKGAFKLNKRPKLDGKTVLIVDDVFTTGATSNEVSRVVSKLNPKAIYVLTFAKTLFEEGNIIINDK